MRWLRAWFIRLSGVLRGGSSDREIADELESHLQMHIEDNLRRGMSAQDARREALMKLGGVAQTQESYRERLSFIGASLRASCALIPRRRLSSMCICKWLSSSSAISRSDEPPRSTPLRRMNHARNHLMKLSCRIEWKPHNAPMG